MSSEDLELRCGVRNALTRHWIDLTKTNFYVRRGHVQLSGEVSVVGAQRPSEDTAEALKAFESDVRRLQEVKSVSFEFTNWVRNDSGAWTCLIKTDSANASPATRDGATGEVADSY